MGCIYCRLCNSCAKVGFLYRVRRRDSKTVHQSYFLATRSRLTDTLFDQRLRVEVVRIPVCSLILTKILTYTVQNACTTHKPTTTSKRSKSTTSKITDRAWNNSKKPSGRSARCSACANSADMPFRKQTSHKPECCRRMIRREREEDMERWLARRRRKAGDETLA